MMGEADTTVSIEYCELRKTKSDSDSADDVTIFKKEQKKSRLIEKIVHLLSIVTIICLTHGAIYKQWLIPYIYTIVTPILLVIRVVMYWKLNYQYFLLDFCYFANIFVFVHIWIPDNETLFFIVFGLANGPLIWAMFVYRNAVVFHSVDKVTSSYIHYLPPLVSFVVRWYPESTSQYWMDDFKPSTEVDVNMVIGLTVFPFICFFIHSILYHIIVQRILKPSDDYITSYSYLSLKEEACLTKLFHCCGKKHKCIMFYVFNWIFCLVSLTGVMLWYNFYIPHCILMVFQACAIIWQGANYYMHVFAVKGFADE
ncbi:unnamed protein product [Mytilus coruscus]|uniref:Glycerophosphocholine acyltransferase 1 n=1 Tax=Mytilus coruscus TaxID=42192 RepID=A0A6J8A1E5_MYTCO|nr:unnamed protein product [Mytilus coruscus]